MKSTKIVIALFFTFAIGFVGLAQHRSQGHQNMSPEERAQKKTSFLVKELELSADQEQAVKQVLTESAQEMENIKSKYPELQEAKESMKDLHGDMRKQVKEVLTDEQKKALKNARMEARESDEPRDREEGIIAKLEKHITLSADQKAQLEKIEANSKAKMDALRKQYPNMEAAKEEMKALKERTDKELKSIFTADQYEKYQSLRQGRKGKGHKRAINNKH